MQILLPRFYFNFLETLTSKKDSSSASKLRDAEQKSQKINDENKNLTDKIKSLEEKLTKQESAVSS